MNGYPRREIAEGLVKEAEACNPGPWGDHSRAVARCAEQIAAAAGLNSEKAYVLGMLHDIGRKFGVKHLAHVWDGYRYLTELGYGEAAKICLTHSFCYPSLDDYIGRHDLPEEVLRWLARFLEEVEYDDYDRLIQLCDCLVGGDGVVDLNRRMADIERRYGTYPRRKWDTNLWLKAYFDKKCGKDIYEITR